MSQIGYKLILPVNEQDGTILNIHHPEYGHSYKWVTRNTPAHYQATLGTLTSYFPSVQTWLILDVIGKTTIKTKTKGILSVNMKDGDDNIPTFEVAF